LEPIVWNQFLSGGGIFLIFRKRHRKSFTQKERDRPKRISNDAICVVGDVQSGLHRPRAVSVARREQLHVLGQQLVRIAPGISVVAVVVARPDVHPL